MDILVGVASWHERTLRWLHTFRKYNQTAEIHLYLTHDDNLEPHQELIKKCAHAYHADIRLSSLSSAKWAERGNCVYLGFQWHAIAMSAMESPDARIIRTDVHDVIFQGDPFEMLPADMGNLIYQANEGLQTRHNPYQLGWYRHSSRFDAFNESFDLENQWVYNSGMIAARGEILQYIADANQHARFGTWADQTETQMAVMSLCNAGIAQLHEASTALFFPMNHQYTTHGQGEFNNGQFVIDDLTTPAVVHANGDDCKPVIDRIWHPNNARLLAHRIINDIEIESPTVAAYISTTRVRDCVDTVDSLLSQTVRLDQIIIYDDCDPTYDWQHDERWQCSYARAERSCIPITMIDGYAKGQVRNHEIARSTIASDYIWRIDDDEVAEPDVLQKMLNTFEPDVAAVAPLVLDPRNNMPHHPLVSSQIEDIITHDNIQWFAYSGPAREVDHLYSSFTYKRSYANHSYLKLSPVGHREETVFTYGFKQAGYRNMVCDAVIWHNRDTRTGIHANPAFHQVYQQHDEQIFHQYMQNAGVQFTKIFPIFCGHGIGDAEVLARVIPDIIEKYGRDHKIIISCRPNSPQWEIMSQFDVTMIDSAIGNVKGFGQLSIYSWMDEHNWNSSVEDAYRQLYKLGVKT